jgi:hypothetical protein
VETRSQGGRELQFVPWIHYQTVLLSAFGPGGYRLVPRGVPRTEGSSVTWTGALFVRAPGSSKFQFIKEAKGECNASIGASAAEGAQSDCLVKCCKALGIFMELFDPRWRRAWEAKYRPQHEQEKRQAAWPAARAGVTGGDSSAAAPAASTTTTDKAPSSHAVPAAETSGASSPSTDTGEAASAEAKQAVIQQWKRLQWKAGFIKMWIAEVFGVQVHDARRAPEALSQKQAEAAHLLLNVHGTPLYDTLLKQWKETGELS